MTLAELISEAERLSLLIDKGVTDLTKTAVEQGIRTSILADDISAYPAG